MYVPSQISVALLFVCVGNPQLKARGSVTVTREDNMCNCFPALLHATVDTSAVLLTFRATAVQFQGWYF